MKLIDAFLPVFEYIQSSEFNLNEDSKLTFETAFDEIKKLLMQNKSKVLSAGYEEKHFQDALFAICAMIDEKILASDWPHHDEWLKRPLQKLYFDCSVAGTQFFQRLDKLNEYDLHEQDVRVIYLYCLRLGFSGCYFESGEQSRLQEIIQANFLLLSKRTSDELFSASIPTSVEEEQTDFRLVKFRELSATWGPILFVILTFLYLRNDLLTAISEFVSTI